MNLPRLYQYIQRFTHVYLSAWPGSYRKKRLKILREFYGVVNGHLRSLRVDYWLDFGTLLGYYREADILPHDIDVDFGMSAKDFETVWASRSRLPAGFTMYNTSHKHRGAKLYISYRGFDADIYFYEDRGSVVKSFENSSYPNECQEIPKELIYPLKSVEFLGQRCLVPARDREYLEFVYGYLGRDAVRNEITGFWQQR